MAAAPDETARGLAVSEPGVRVAGAEDVDPAEPAHPLPVREHDERPRRAGGGRRGRQEGEPPGTGPNPGPAGRGRGGRPSRAQPGYCAGRRGERPPPGLAPPPRPLAKFPPVFPAGRSVPARRLLLFRSVGGGRPPLSLPGPGVGGPEPRIVPGSPAVIAGARPPRRPLPAAGRRNFRVGAWRRRPI